MPPRHLDERAYLGAAADHHALVSTQELILT
jgi:hypothetical protein